MSAPTAHSKKAHRRAQERAPKLVENPKRAIFLRGNKTSAEVTALLTDLYKLKKPFAVKYSRRNDIRPFEDARSLEFFSKKADASQFVLASHSKKRPHSLTLGRMYNHQLLDMVELAVTNFRPSESFKGHKPAPGSKACVVLNGDGFESSYEQRRLGNMLLDFFRGPQVKKLSLSGLDHVVVCTQGPAAIHFRHYGLRLKKSGSKLPRVELEEIGPSFDFTVRRHQFAASDLYKEALRVPKQLRQAKVKNVEHNKLGDKLITVHMERQDLNTLALRKRKALKRQRVEVGAKGSPAKRQRPADADEEETQT